MWSQEEFNYFTGKGPKKVEEKKYACSFKPFPIFNEINLAAIFKGLPPTNSLIGIITQILKNFNAEKPPVNERVAFRQVAHQKLDDCL